MALPDVFECAAACVNHPEAGEALVLFVVPKEGAKPTLADIRRGLPPHWAIDSLQVVVELPKNAHGKISRPALNAQARPDHVPV